MEWWHYILIACSPVVWIIPHTLIGALLMLPYGVEKIRWDQGAIEVVAKKKADGKTRIWFQPGAQTWGIIIFYAREDDELFLRDGRHYIRRGWNSKPLKIHERVHILQSYLFGVLYPVTYLFVFFPLLYIAVLLGAWKNSKDRDNMWRAYRRIPWEIWAYAKGDKFERGEIPGAWGA